MNKEDKELLLKDLCARLPYGVKMSNINAIHNGLNLPPITVEITDYENSNPLLLIDSGFRPYLRPMSNMTDEERLKLSEITHCNILYINDAIGVTFKLLDDASFLDNVKAIDWLNARHFDYRGLIKKGLALEAPEGMYNLA